MLSTDETQSYILKDKTGAFANYTKKNGWSSLHIPFDGGWTRNVNQTYYGLADSGYTYSATEITEHFTIDSEFVTTKTTVYAAVWIDISE